MAADEVVVPVPDDDDDDDDDQRPLSIQSLPAEVFELILRLVSPYEDLRNCRLVCREWHKLVQDVVRRRRSGFVRDVRTMNVRWFHQPASSGPSIVARYGHACCRHADSMYVFGGCTGRNTTFNDLWRFDLNSRRWIRPLAVGTYPPPMAFSTFVLYDGILVLFGGLTYPSPSVLHQFHNYRLYNKLHFYETHANQWSELITTTSPPHVAGHSATVHGHLMVVFGGRQFVNGRYHGKSNDVWVLNLKTIVWWKQTTTDPKPPPMVNQTQVAIDDDHLLIIDGYGGPNMLLSYAWLLKLEREPDVPWSWTKMIVRNQHHAVSNLWYHPACKVEDKLVFLGRGSRSMSPMSSSMSQVIQIPLRIWIPPREEDVPLLRVVDDESDDPARDGTREKNKSEIETCVNGKRGVLPVKNWVQQRSCDDFSPAPSSSSSSTSPLPPSSPPTVLDAEASCSSSCSESKKTTTDDRSDDTESISNRPGSADECSQCGNPKLHSQKRRKLSSAGAEEVVADDTSDDPLTTEWCHCSTTDENSSLEGFASSVSAVAVLPSSSSPEVQQPSPSIVRNSVMPSVRPNSLKNRVRQMESFQRMEQRIRNMMRPTAAAAAGAAAVQQPPPPQSPPPQPNLPNGSPFKQHLVTSARQPMVIYVLDISGAIDRGEVEWLPLHDQSSSDGPEDTAFYSLVKGRGEIIMFGGIQKDHNSRNQVPFCGRNTVTNHVYILGSKPPF